MVSGLSLFSSVNQVQKSLPGLDCADFREQVSQRLQNEGQNNRAKEHPCKHVNPVHRIAHGFHEISQCDVGQVELQRVGTDQTEEGIQLLQVFNSVEDPDKQHQKTERVNHRAEADGGLIGYVAVGIDAEQNRGGGEDGRGRPFYAQAALDVSSHISSDGENRDTGHGDINVRGEFRHASIQDEHQKVDRGDDNQKVDSTCAAAFAHEGVHDRKGQVERDQKADEPDRRYALRKEGIEKQVFHHLRHVQRLQDQILDAPEGDGNQEIRHQNAVHSALIKPLQVRVLMIGIVQAHSGQEEEDFYADTSDIGVVAEKKRSLGSYMRSRDYAGGNCLPVILTKMVKHNGQHGKTEELIPVFADPVEIEHIGILSCIFIQSLFMLNGFLKMSILSTHY